MLSSLTTLRVGGPAARFVRATSEAELVDTLRAVRGAGEQLLVIGGGSNLVVGDAGFAGTVVQIATRGVQLDGERVTAAAGVVWDELVAQLVAEGFAGVECLSGIPGLVGATPMQNVGAYGQEVAETITHVRAFDRVRGEIVTFSRDQCAFAYRTSTFKGSARHVILDVTFTMSREPEGIVRYAELARALGVPEGGRAPLATIRQTVIELRRGKGMVIDPADPDSRSAGSFFTNPIIAAALAPDGAPRWPQPDGRVKISAAWLIERAGFAKGTARRRVGISSKHALALVTRDGATASELLAFAREIQDAVRGKLGIALEPEPVIVGA